MFTRADVMFGLDPSLTTRAAATVGGRWRGRGVPVWQVLLLRVGSAVYFVCVCVCVPLKEQSSRGLRACVCLCAGLAVFCVFVLFSATEACAP